MPVIQSFKSPTTREEAVKVVALALQDAIGDVAMVTRHGHGVEIQWADDADDVDFTLVPLDHAQMRDHGMVPGYGPAADERPDDHCNAVITMVEPEDADDETEDVPADA